MFCPKCGQKLTDQAKFCTRCGADIQSLMRQSASAPEPPKPESSAPVSEFSKPGSAKEGASLQKTSASKAKHPEKHSGSYDNDLWGDIVGKNQTYYLPEFQKIQSGEKSRFNWAAFLFGPAFCFYRKSGDLFKKFFLVSTFLLFAGYLVLAIGMVLFEFTLIAIGGIIEMIAAIWQLVNMIRLGKRFNQLYFERCSSTKEISIKSGTSVKAACLFYAIVMAATLIINLGSGIVAQLHYSFLSDADIDSSITKQWNDDVFSDSNSLNGNRVEDYQVDNPQSGSLTQADIPTTSQDTEYVDFFGEFDDLVGSWQDEEGNGYYLFIGYSDKAKQHAYASVSTAAADFEVELTLDNGGGANGALIEGDSSEPSYIIELGRMKYWIEASIYYSEYDFTDYIKFVPADPDSCPYENPYYTD
jgi:hypothetical protein